MPVEFSKGEAGKGQHEINLDYTTAVEMADRNTVYKNAAKEIAALNGRSISFMAKYGFDETGSSCHIHSSLWSDNGTEPAMHDARGEHGMSEVFRWWLGGLLATAAEFSLLWAPTINSYKRFQPGSWAPTAIGWGLDNRTLGYRKVGHGKGTRVECRIPGSDANSYFAFAGTLAGGLHGIVNRIEPPPAVHRQRLRRHRPAEDPVEHRRGDRPVGVLGRGQAGLRPRRPPSHPQHGQAGVGGVQHGGHRLGAPPLLGADLSRGCRSSRSRDDERV